MSSLKLILYPYVGAIAAMTAVMIFATVGFGDDPRNWQNWQNQLVSNVGILVGAIGALAGAYLATRSERKST